MKLSIFVVVFALIAACTGQKNPVSPVEFAIKCIREYKTVLANYNDDKGTCIRWQILVDCLSKRRELTSQMVDAMRYFVTQNAIFLAKMSLCPNIDFKDLKEITDNTDFAKSHKYLDRIKADKADQCAGDVYLKCSKTFLTIFASNHKLCDDVNIGIKCIAAKKKASGCDADILKHYEQMMLKVGGLMVREVRRYAGIECKSDS